MDPRLPIGCSLQNTALGLGVQVAGTLSLRDKDADDLFRSFVDCVLFAVLDQLQTA